MENYMGKIPVNEGRASEMPAVIQNGRWLHLLQKSVIYNQNSTVDPAIAACKEGKSIFVTSLKSGHGAVQLHCTAAGWWWSGTAGQHGNYSRKWPDP